MKDELEDIQPQETIPPLPKNISDMFDLFFELKEDAPFWEQFDTLTNAIAAYRVYLLKRHRTTGKKVTDAEEVFLYDCNEQHKHIEKMMMSAKKLGRLAGTVNENHDKNLLGKIIKMKGSVGDIVTTVPIIKKEAPNA